MGEDRKMEEERGQEKGGGEATGKSWGRGDRKKMEKQASMNYNAIHNACKCTQLKYLCGVFIKPSSLSNRWRQPHLSMGIPQGWVHQLCVQGLVVATRHRLLGLHDLVEQHEGLDPRGNGSNMDHFEQCVQMVLQ